MSEICTVCLNECRGGFEVYERTRADGTFEIVVDTTPDGDFNVCDLCNVAVHFRCSLRPETGYCDACLDRLEEFRTAEE